MPTYRYRSQGLARGLRLACAWALFLACAVPLRAQERRYLVELSAAGLYQSFDSVTRLKGTLGGAGRVGVWLPYHLSVEAEGSVTSSTTKETDVDVSVRTLTASLLYNIPLGRRTWVHLRLGGGSTRFGDPCPTPRSAFICGSSSALVGGAGARFGLTPELFVRGDALLSRNRSMSDRTIVNFGVGVGLSYMLGSRPIPDSDSDGTLDNSDRCPATPAGAQVDGTGCPRDSDDDGVPDGVDRCDNTVPQATVDATGCTSDSDGDNIADGLDRCPETPAGVLVDPNGCPRDSDDDSIPDGLDRCSETPRGATVDALGCPGDEDGDGVLDGLDRCPRTQSGAAINSSGCATSQTPGRTSPAAPPEAEPSAQAAPTPPAAAPPRTRPRPTDRTPAPVPARAAGRIVAGVLPGVSFAPGTARLLPESYIALDSVVQILQADTALRVEVGSHTDNSGAGAQDLHLTNLQAEAVRTYLVTRGVAFQQVVARGYGSSRPLTPDTTPRGRVANRRVEIKPVAPGL